MFYSKDETFDRMLKAAFSRQAQRIAPLSESFWAGIQLKLAQSKAQPGQSKARRFVWFSR